MSISTRHLLFSPCVRSHDIDTDVDLTHRNHGSHFEKAKAAFEEGAVRDEAIVESEDHHDEKDESTRPTSLEDVKEKSSVDRV